MPELIFAGKVYRAMPPLYRAKTTKSEVYMYSDKVLAEYRKTHKNFDIHRYKGYE